MKRFLLVAVLLMSGFFMTAQTTVEEKKAAYAAASNGTTFRMQCIGNHLAYNGVRLNEISKSLLLGDEIAGQYEIARENAVMGDAFIITGTALTALGLISVLVEPNLGEEVSENVHNAMNISGYVVGGVGVCMLPVGIVFRVKGAKAMDKIANDFNQQHGVAKMNINPSIMNCKAPGMQNQCVIGATMSLNF